MQVHDAIEVAKKYLLFIFRDESISNVGLEEVVFDHETNHWRITLGFFRPWNKREPLNPASPLDDISHRLRLEGRSFKVVSIDDKTGQAVSLLNRELVS